MIRPVAVLPMQDTIILSAVIITCSLFTLLYWWNK